VNNIWLLVVVVVWVVAAATIQPRGGWSRSKCIALVVVVVVGVGVDVDMGVTSRWFTCNQESVHDGFVVPLLVLLSITWYVGGAVRCRYKGGGGRMDGGGGGKEFLLDRSTANGGGGIGVAVVETLLAILTSSVQDVHGSG
jgi:hypothetical protein